MKQEAEKRAGGTAAGNGVLLNAYPDSMDKNLAGAVRLLARPEFEGVFDGFYILPSVFNSDLDRGFSVIDYALNEALASEEDLAGLEKLGISLKLDFVLNHASVLSPQFRDILLKGEASAYRDFFIDWNRFWHGCGSMTDEGYIHPDETYLKEMFFRKPGLPLLMVTLPDGTRKPYWNTFYQEVKYQKLDAQDLVFALGMQYGTAVRLAERVNEGLQRGERPEAMDVGPDERFREGTVALLRKNCRYLGQMDLNIESPLVWQFYDETLARLAGYGAEIVRLDAFAYAPKKPGERNFLNDPGTWDFLARIRTLADKYSLRLLPEIHAEYGEKMHERLANEGYLTYDFFLPGLIIHALEKARGDYLRRWAGIMRDKGMQTVNMLGCHDGIPLLDLRGLLPEEDIDELIQTVVTRGGYVKDLHGSQKMYYQVNATYFSALGEDEAKMLLARAIQIFMPGRPQVWYLDLFGGKNDHEAMRRAGEGGHKEINRSNLAAEQIEAALGTSLVQKQLQLLRFRNSSPVFKAGCQMERFEAEGEQLLVQWQSGCGTAVLTASLREHSFCIQEKDHLGKLLFQMES